MYVQPLDGSLAPNSLAAPAGGEAEGLPYAGAAAPAVGDNIARFVPPWGNDGAGDAQYGYGESGYPQGIFGSLMGVLQQLMQMLQSLMGYGCPTNGQGGCPPYAGGCPPYGKERYFQNATGASDGDPHLSFNGQRWNNMASQPDLLNSDSFAGGFRISTQVTPPNGKGATWNQSATVTMNNGATTVSMNDNGQATITSSGRQIPIARGQTLQLGDGESVTYEQNGSLRVLAQNGQGGRIETTLNPQDKGVNVDVTAHDVDLGGTLVNGYERQAPPAGPVPVPGPILGQVPGGPVLDPIPGGPILEPIPHPVPASGPIVGRPITGPFPASEPFIEPRPI